MTQQEQSQMNNISHNSKNMNEPYLDSVESRYNYSRAPGVPIIPEVAKLCFIVTAGLLPFGLLIK